MKQQNLMGVGIGAAAASVMAEANGLAAAITAAGTTQATAQAIYADVNIVTVAAASSGVLLPADRAVGDTVEVTNLGANALAVYPPTGGNIGTGAANAAFSVPVSKTARFRLVSATQWTQVLSA